MTVWAIVPAAGVGRRFGAAVAKQYLPLAGSTVIEQTLAQLLAVPAIAKIVVAIGAQDETWHSLACANEARITAVSGGAERQESVLNALDQLLVQQAQPDDWVLVHDAVRPCVLPSEIEALIDAVGEDAVGGLLAAAMDNTVKQQEAAIGEEGQQRRVALTLDRGALWNALTPQMFRVGMLHAALSDAQLSGALTTDEASALERLGHAPLIVGGDKANIKITHASDLLLAEAILAARSTRSDRS